MKCQVRINLICNYNYKNSQKKFVHEKLSAFLSVLKELKGTYRTCIYCMPVQGIIHSKIDSF